MSESSRNERNEEVGRALVLTDAAGNLYVIPAEKIADGLIKEKARGVIEKSLKRTQPGEDFKLLGTYELSVENRRVAYARPRVSIVVGQVEAGTA